jgi:aspartate 1-decarboxylase
VRLGPSWDVQDIEQYDGSLDVDARWLDEHQGIAAGYTSVRMLDYSPRQRALFNTSGEFTVLSNDHASGLIGQYFNFSVDVVNAVLGRSLVDGEELKVENRRTGQTGLAVLWTRANGGSIGDGHGRWVSGAAPGQWEVGDVLTVRSFTVLSNDHASGLVGQYFNFDVDVVSAALGRVLVNGEELNVQNLRTGETKTAVFWTHANGGSAGDGHGRWVSGAAPGQWEVGDLVAFTDPLLILYSAVQ